GGPDSLDCSFVGLFSEEFQVQTKHLTALSGGYSAVLQIALLTVAKCQPDTESHKSNWGDYQHEDTFADGPLAVLGGCRGGTATHGATLAQRGSSPQEERQDEKCGTNSHFTPR